MSQQQAAMSGFMPMVPMANGNGLGNGMVPVNPGSGMPNNSPMMNMNKPAGMPGEWLRSGHKRLGLGPRLSWAVRLD